MTRYDFHPEALGDLDEIWEFIATDNIDAADRVVSEILAAVDALVAFPNQGINAQTLVQSNCVLLSCVSTSLPMRLKNSLFGLLQ